jgi:hypothetical protein
VVLAQGPGPGLLGASVPREEHSAILGAVASFWEIPEGVRVLPDGAWRVGGFPIIHTPSLRHLKTRLLFDDEGGAFIADGSQRMPVRVEGPPFEVLSLVLDGTKGEAHALLDDGTEELVTAGSLSMNEESGRFECLARGGRCRAVFSRAAHQSLLDSLAEEEGRFFIRVGSLRIPIRT